MIGAAVLGDPSTPFWSTRADSAYVKVSFTIVIFAVAVIVRICATRTAKYEQVQEWGRRSILTMAAFAIAGGLFSSVAGSGTDVFLFVFVVLVAQVSPRVAIPTSIIAMAAVSVLGLAVFGLWHGQLAIDLNDAGTQVIGVGGEVFGPEAATRFDLFGIWLAAAPIVVWGAPLGAWVAAKVSERTVIRFVAVMALAEVITTLLFLDQMRSDYLLLAYFATGMVLVYLAVYRLDRLSDWIMAGNAKT